MGATNDSKDKTLPQKASLSEADKLVFQAHMAEYQALMTRSTSLHQWQWALIPAAGVVLGILANARDVLDARLLAWGVAGVVQIAMICSWQLWLDRYNDILYIETELRRRMHELVDRERSASCPMPFWEHELYLARQRRRGLLWHEWAAVSCAPLLVIVTAIIRWPFSQWDYVGLVVNVALIICISHILYQVVKLRNCWSDHLRALPYRRV